MKIYNWFVNNIVLVIFLIIGIYLNYEVLEYNPRVVILNIGQGDSIFLIDSSGEKFLIDGGDGDYIVYSISHYLHPRDKVIDNLILTHPHQDHMSGLIDIIERYDVKRIYYYPVCYNSLLYKYFLNLDENLKIIDPNYYFEGDSFTLKLLFPKEEIDEGCVEYSNINNASIVLKLESNFGSMLFTGDAEHEVEDWLMKYYSRDELNVDVLKAGHHCSRTASSLKFLNYISPFYAICSVGEGNRFGHPHSEVINNFNQLNIIYDLTYEVGDIVFEL